MWLSNLGISANKSADKSSLQDQDKKQISFLVKHFPVKNSDRLVPTAAQKVLDLQFLKFWEWHNGCHLVSFLMYISGAKFEKHCSNISRDILDSVFYCLSCPNYI